MWRESERERESECRTMNGWLHLESAISRSNRPRSNKVDMSQVFELHIDTSATSDIQINAACFPPDAASGDLIAVRPHLGPGSKGKAKDSPLLFKIEPATVDAPDGKLGSAGGVSSSSAAAVAAQPRRRTAAAVTVSPTLASAFGWVQNRIRVDLELIASPPPPALCASHVELYFNNLYLSRPDSFVLALNLIGKVIHSNQRILLPGSGARLRVGDMWSSATTQPRRRRGSTFADAAQSSSTSHNLDSAYVTDATKLIFRSESSRSYLFIEVSQEMWQFEEDGGMLVEKCEMFLDEVFAHYSGKMSRDSEDKRSKGIPTSHVVSVILYGRVIYDDPEDAEEERAPLSQASDGTYYRDFFKVRQFDLAPSNTDDAKLFSPIPLGHPRSHAITFSEHHPDGRGRTSTVAGARAPTNSRRRYRKAFGKACVRPRVACARGDEPCAQLVRGALDRPRPAPDRVGSHRPHGGLVILPGR